MVNQIKNFNGKLNNLGKVKMQGILTCINKPRNPHDIQVFLFEQMIIFSDIVSKHFQRHCQDFLYIDHIKVSKTLLKLKIQFMLLIILFILY